MPSTLDRGDRKLLIGAGALLAVLIFATTYLAPKQRTGTSAYPSSYSAEWDGAKGPYVLLQNLHYQVERWEQSPENLSEAPANAVLVLASPTQTPTAEEKTAVLEFLQRGGRVFASGAGASKILPEAAELSENYAIEEATKFPALLPSPLMRGAPEISMFPPDDWQPKTAGQLVVYGNEETAAVMEYPVGKGQVVWWGNSSPLTNGGIRDSGNLPLFLNSVGPPDGVRVLWDEYFHGAHGTLWNYIGNTPLVWGAVQFGMAFLAMVATYSRRQGPISVPVRVSRLSPLEFVETLGDLYTAAHAGSTAVRIAYQRLRFQLTRQLGLAPNASDTDVAQLASKALAWKEEEISSTLSRAHRAAGSEKVGDAETLQLVQEMFDYGNRLELRRERNVEERPPA